MPTRQQQHQFHPLSCAAPHRHWPENAHLNCYAQVHGAPYEARIQRKFATGERVRVAERYVGGGYSEPHALTGALGHVTGQVGARVLVALDARDYEDDVEDFTAAALDPVPHAV